MLALLIAVATALLFSFSSADSSPATQLGSGDAHCSIGDHEVPVASRQQEPLDNSSRRDGPDPFEPQLHEWSLTMVQTFGAWPLPPPSTTPRTRSPGGWYARGPPMC